MNPYAFLADVLVGLHLLYILIVIVGQIIIIIGFFRRWRFVRSIFLRCIHLIMILVVTFQAIFDIPCILTIWENQLRAKAGQSTDADMTFVARLFRLLVYYNFPPWFFTMLYVGFGALVLFTFILIPPRRKRYLNHRL